MNEGITEHGKNHHPQQYYYTFSITNEGISELRKNHHLQQYYNTLLNYSSHVNPFQTYL